MEPDDGPNFLLTEDHIKWWKGHQAMDKARRTAEEAARLAKEAEGAKLAKTAALRSAGLAKLLAEKRLALGLPTGRRSGRALQKR
jgi:hypothetical protein